MKELYYCNPFLNDNCKKGSCYLYNGPCLKTTKKECALIGKDGEPLRAPDFDAKKDDIE